MNTMFWPWVGDKGRMDQIAQYSLKIKRHLKRLSESGNIELIDFKLEFGKTSDGKIILADEISPDTCRFWDKRES